MLRPADNTKALELILAMGSYGSGKTNAWMTWAWWMKRTGSEGKVFVLNTDRPMARLFDTWDGLEDVVTVYPDVYSTVENYGHLEECTRRMKEKIVVGRNDVVVVDLIGTVWDMCQDSYSEAVYGLDLATLMVNKKAEYQDYLAQAKANREKNIKGEAPALGGDHGAEWGPINRMYRSFTSGLLRMNAHVFACAGVSPVGKGDKGLPEEIVRLGIKPKGQKDLGHFFDTTLHFQTMGVGDWRVGTVRETSGPMRNRKRLEGEKIGGIDAGGFVGAYLVGVAGWQI